jgi:hypothetical protein
MLPRLGRRQRPRRFSRPAADVLVLEAITFLLSGKHHYIPLQTGLQLHSHRNELPPHQRGCEITNSKRLAGDHCTNNDNDLRLGQLDSSSDCLRANATVKRPSLTSPYEGREPAIKGKEPKVRSQVALTVSSAEATAFAVGSLTCGSHHLSTDDVGRLRTNAAPTGRGRPSAHEEVLAPVLATTPRCGQRRGTGRGRDRPAHDATVARAVDRQPRPDQMAGGNIRGGAKPSALESQARCSCQRLHLAGPM